MYNGSTRVHNALRDVSQSRPPLALNKPCADTLYTLTPYPLTLPILPGSWLTNCCFRLNSIVTAFQKDGKKRFPKKRKRKEKAHSEHACPRAVQQSWSLANSQHIVSACPSKYYPQHWQQPLYPFANLSIFSIYLEDFQEALRKKKLKQPKRKPSIACRNSLFKCKTKISGLFSMPMRLQRKQSSQRTVDRKQGKSFLGIKTFCVLERHGARKHI